MHITRAFKGDSRTALVKKNIAGSFVIKGWNSIVQLLLVPLTLQCLTQYEYGIWLTISSILVWIDLFDIGLGNGLRNKLAEAVANKDLERARQQTSTTFLMLTVIIIPLTALVMGLIEMLDCHSLFNASPQLLPHLNDILKVSVALVGATFIFKFIGNIYLGLQLPAINNLLVALGRTLSLIVVAVLALAGDHSLMHVAIAYTASPLVVYIAAYPITFSRYPYLTPAVSAFRKSELRSLVALGVKFFLVQIAAVVLFASSNLIISNTVSPEEVTPYQISYYYFSIPLMLFSIIIAPIWSATTDAYTIGDWEWIRKTEHKMHRIVLAMMAVIALMILIAPVVYKIWLGDKVEFRLSLAVGMAVYMTVIIFSLCYSNILSGIGKIWLLTIVTIIEAVVFLPLAFCLGKTMGVNGIITALIIVNSLCAVTNYLQFKKLSRQTATGIWNM